MKITPLTEVEGAFVIEFDRYSDNRGSFQEVYNESRYGVMSRNWQQLNYSVSKKHTVRGLHCSPYPKLCTCIKGELMDVVVDLRKDSPTYLKWAGVWLNEDNKKQLYVPAHCGHGFYSARDDTIIFYFQGGVWNKANDVEINWRDPTINIAWPEAPEYVVSEKDESNPMLPESQGKQAIPASVAPDHKYECMLVGASGYFGEYFVKYLVQRGVNFYVSTTRLEHVQDLARELDTIKPKYVICAAGIAGRPNIDWCEDHKEETVRVNVLGQMNLVDLCHQRGIHATICGTGTVFNYDEQHPMGSTVGFTEQDKPNFDGNFYDKMRIQLENLIQLYPNALYLRIVFPIAGDLHPRSVLTKLTQYKQIISVPSSFTIIEDLWPVAIDLAARGKTGIYNFTNPGVTSADKILEMYKQIVDPTLQFDVVQPEIQSDLQKAKRGNRYLDTSKLLSEYPQIPDVMVSIERICRNIVAHKQQEQQQ